MKLWAAISADAQRNGVSTRRLIPSLFGLSTFWLVVVFRLSHALHRMNVPLLPNMLRATGMVIWGADLWPAATIGPGLVIAHSVGVVVGSGVRAGRNLTLFSGAVLGSSAYHYVDGSAEPTLGDDVTVWTRGIVAGGVKIPSGSHIPAGAVVTSSL